MVKSSSTSGYQNGDFGSSFMVNYLPILCKQHASQILHATTKLEMRCGLKIYMVIMPLGPIQDRLIDSQDIHGTSLTALEIKSSINPDRYSTVGSDGTRFPPYFFLMCLRS